LPHPFTLACRAEGGAGGLLSVALSLGSPPPAVSRHRVPVEPGLSSSPGRGRDRRPSGRLAGEDVRVGAAGVNGATAAVSPEWDRAARSKVRCRSRMYVALSGWDNDLWNLNDWYRS